LPGHTAELVVLVVRHRSSGWVREIARKDEDNETDATFDPENGVVTVYEGRREFKALERAARKSGLTKNRVGEYLALPMRASVCRARGRGVPRRRGARGVWSGVPWLVCRARSRLGLDDD